MEEKHEFMNNLLKKRDLFPDEWIHDFENYQPLRVDVDDDSIEYKNVKTRLINSKDKCVCKKQMGYLNLCHCDNSIRIIKIERLENPKLWLYYSLKKSEYQIKYQETNNIMNLYHATSKTNLKLIEENNLDWRKVRKGLFGQGISFSSVANYATQRCNVSSQKVLLECEVIANKVLEVDRYPSFPRYDKNSYDITHDRLKLVYVKYTDFEMYPKYIISLC